MIVSFKVSLSLYLSKQNCTIEIEIRLPTFRFRFVNDIEIKKMANSIRQHGLLQPIVVRPKERK